MGSRHAKASHREPVQVATPPRLWPAHRGWFRSSAAGFAGFPRVARSERARVHQRGARVPTRLQPCPRKESRLLFRYLLSCRREQDCGCRAAVCLVDLSDPQIVRPASRNRPARQSRPLHVISAAGSRRRSGAPAHAFLAGGRGQRSSSRTLTAVAARWPRVREFRDPR